METEKYYGLGLDLETTKKDSSIIDCELPGKLPENPSLNTTNTSLLNKASTTSNYKKLVDCPKEFTLTKHNDAITDSSLQVIEQNLSFNGNTNVSYNYSISIGTGTEIILGTRKDVYLGYEDINKIFTNKLSSIITTQVHADLDSDTSGCSARAYLMSNDNTGALIRFSLNKCTADRIITFSYKNTPIFKINQTYEKKETYQTFYIFSISSIGIGNSFALFENNNVLPNSFDMNQTNKINMYMGNGVTQTNGIILFYFCNTPYILNFITVEELINSGKLTHLQGHDYLNTEYNKYKSLSLNKVDSINSYNNYNFSTIQATLAMKISIFISRESGLSRILDYIQFSNTDNANHVGVYKYIIN